jgi:hypothetical protein
MDAIGIRADPLDTILNELSASNRCEPGGDVCGAASIECVSSSCCVTEEATAAIATPTVVPCVERVLDGRKMDESA